MMKLTMCALALLSLSSCYAQDKPKGTFALARNGKAVATIILARNPTRSAEFAAGELQDHVRNITSATLPIVREPDANQTAVVKGARILVGESAATRNLGLKSADFKPQEYLIQSTRDTLILMGNDEMAASDAESAGISEPGRAPGKFGLAASFNGKNTLLSTPDSHFSDETGSLSGWVQLLDKASDVDGTIFRLDGGGAVWTYQIVQQDAQTSTISYRTYVAGKTLHVVTSSPLSPGWHYVMATHSSADNKIELFVDGVSQGVEKYDQTSCGEALLEIGGLPAAEAGKVANPLNGLLDDLRVSKVVSQPSIPDKPGTRNAETTLLLSFDDNKINKSSIGSLTLPDEFSRKGTLNATYDFLERFCGVRWYLPGSVGTVIPQQKTLQVSGVEIRRSPAMKYRYMFNQEFYLTSGGKTMPSRDVALWKLRMRMGGEPYAANHSFYGYYARFLKDHPDWFAGNDEKVAPQLCYSNPQVVSQVAQDARDYFDGKGLKPGGIAAGDFFALVPMDTSLWCPSDRERFDKSEEKNLQFSNGLVSPVVWEFTNEVARQVAKTNPGKYVSQLAYSQYAYLPQGLVLEPNVSVQMCLEARNWWQPSVEANDRKILQQWTTAEGGKRPLFVWLYYCFPALMAKSQNYNAFPGFFAHSVVQQMKLYHQSGISGISLEDSGEFQVSFLMDQLELYLTWRLADDPSLDGNKLIDEFFTRYYGAAAAPMKQLYNEIESTYTDPQNYPESIRNAMVQQHQSEELAWKYLGTPERMAKWQVLMTKAQAAAKTPLEKQRVQLFQTNIWEYMKAGAAHYQEVGPMREKLQAQGPPKLQVPRIADAKGDFSRINWEQAAKSQPWLTTTGAPSKRDVEMKLAHDNKYFYVRVQEKGDSSRIVTTDDIYTGYHWEMFFAAARQAPYRQLSFNLSGKTSALDWKEIGQALHWDSGAKVLSQVTDGLISTQVAIPIDQLTASGVRVGTPFYANFFGAKSSGDPLSWSAIFGASFQDVAHLGELTLEN